MSMIFVISFTTSGIFDEKPGDFWSKVNQMVPELELYENNQKVVQFGIFLNKDITDVTQKFHNFQRLSNSRGSVLDLD